MTDQATPPTARAFDRRALSYATSFDGPLSAAFIRAVEWLTGKLSVIRMIRDFERKGEIPAERFWAEALDVLNLDILTPEAELANIPETGPVVVVANHPHGMVDGMVMAELIGRRRQDYKVLTRSLLTTLDTTASRYLISVPFPYQADAQEKMVEMRSEAMAHLEAGGVIALFPSGSVATARSFFGPAEEAEWNVFTAKLIRTSGASVVPIYFPGANSRAYQMAHQVSATLRQSLLIHEIVRSRNSSVRPVIGEPLSPADLRPQIREPRSFMAWLRARTLALGDGS